MKKLTLTNHVQRETTVLENEFIDHYMTKANGEYVKVYLLLLRHLNAPSGTLTISRIADLLDHTEKDVIRALNYWKKQGLLEYEDTAAKKTAGKPSGSARRRTPGLEASSSGARPAESATPKRRQPESGSLSGTSPAGNAELPEETGSPRDNSATKEFNMLPSKQPESGPASGMPEVSNLQQYKSRKEFKELLFVAEQYLGKTLSSTDVETIAYFYETLHMSTDLTEYLIEYCVENGHKSMHYIRKVALSWHERGISTVEEAKAGTLTYNRNCYTVLNAFGIKGRAPAASELNYIKKWTEEYGFSLDIITEACDRTMGSIHQPSFDYADSILKDWASRKVRRMEDIKVLDASFLKEKERRKKQASRPSSSRNKFNNFEGRSYDMNELERRLIQQ